LRASGSQGVAYREVCAGAPNRRPHYASSPFGPGPTGESMSALRSPFPIRPVCALLIPAVVACGCTTMRVVQRPVAPGNIDSAASGMASVRPGDEVRVTLRDGRQVRFEVLAVDSTGIVALDRSRYATPDILRVERRSFSGAKTAILLAAGVATFVLVLYAVAVASLAGNF
jgi:hypothetical protein